MQKELNMVFMGTPDLAATVLRALLENGYAVSAVVTQPDKPKGRGKAMACSPVKELAVEKGIPVLQPERAKDEAFIEELCALKPDIIVVAAYGKILPKAILDMPRFGCINVHTSLLPDYKGAAPIQWAILNGEQETGVTIMYMDEGCDTGDIISAERIAIGADETGGGLHDKLAVLGGELLDWMRAVPGRRRRKALEGMFPLLINHWAIWILHALRLNWNVTSADWIHGPVRLQSWRVRC